MNKPKDVVEIDIMQIVQAILHRLWVVILSAVLGGAILFSYATYRITPQYMAQAMLYVNNNNLSLQGASLSISGSDLTTAQNLVSTYIVILNSRLTLNEVISESGLDYSYEQLKGMISAESVNNTAVLRVSVTSPDPQEARLIANTILDVLPEKITDVINGSSVRVVDYAVTPSSKISPNITKYTEIGILLGIAIACLIIALFQITDKLIHNEEYLTETYKLPVLAIIPDLYNNSKSGYNYNYKGGYNGYEKTEKEVTT